MDAAAAGRAPRAESAAGGWAVVPLPEAPEGKATAVVAPATEVDEVAEKGWGCGGGKPPAEAAGGGAAPPPPALGRAPGAEAVVDGPAVETLGSLVRLL